MDVVTSGGQERAGEPVELRSQASAEEIREALDATRKLRTSPWFYRLFALLGAALIAGRGASADGGARVAIMVLAAAYLLYASLHLPRQLRGPSRLPSRRTVVGADGVTRVLSEDGKDITTPWARVPRWRETPGTFVLLNGSWPGMCVLVLPKRAVVGDGGVERLRALLGRHSTEK
ncbi:YcxB family protein [Streptomyces avicenniae]|uniref:YcxB family protein n=1 Tax=Streptomyces avicenniae TaxID=500153 RepID=UPI0006993AD5|nr:YcxB family protein [Streptomyces avicenniae]